MFQDAKINNYTEEQGIHLKIPQDCKAFLQCNLPSIYCILGKFDQCAITKQLQLQLEQAFHQNLEGEISYKKWTSTDRANLENVVQNTEEFLTTFMKTL